MAYRIAQGCSACGLCVRECPVDCITAGRKIYTIDESRCIDCGACAKSCPMRVIFQLPRATEETASPGS
ncbi:MAG: 4Fe-4S binding protein [Bradymonadales bacterium]|nr:4Fe-4S binding protein [Bradymonadales bacterium]